MNGFDSYALPYLDPQFPGFLYQPGVKLMPPDDTEGKGPPGIGTHFETPAVKVELCPINIHMRNLGYIQTQLL